MTMSDPISDLLTRIRNGIHRKKTVVESPSSNVKVQILDVLKREGYIRGYTLKDNPNNTKDVVIELKYDQNGESVIQGIDRLSKPGRREYFGAKRIPLVLNGLGTIIVTTSKGVLSDNEARKINAGGEAICRVY